MKKQIVQLFTGVLAAGMIIATGFTGVAATGSVASVETVEYSMKENQASKNKKATKSDYDEVIKSLKKGQAYALIELKGSNGKLLAVSNDAYDDPHFGICAESVTVYGKVDGKIKKLGEARAAGTSSPLAIYDGELYACAHSNVYTYVVAGNGKELSRKDYGDHFSTYNKKAKKVNFTMVK